jgi:hypothetical protein
MLDVSTVGLPGAFLKLKKTTAEEVMRHRLPFMVQNLKRKECFNWVPPTSGIGGGGNGGGLQPIW